MLNDLGPESTIYKRHYMMLWPNPRNAWHAMCESIVYALSALELSQPGRKKVRFVLETREGGHPKVSATTTFAHIDLSRYARKISQNFRFLGFSVFGRGGGSGLSQIGSWRGFWRECGSFE